MGRCLLCGKTIDDENGLCKECKKYQDTSNGSNENTGNISESDSVIILQQRRDIYNDIKPSDGKGWYILSAIFGALTFVFMIAFFICIGYDINELLKTSMLGACGSSIFLCILTFFFGQVIKRKNIQIFLQNDIKKVLSEIKDKIR
ncbi:MAG: hypothetical protein ACI4XA_03800 [Oscillospiraceae bacterium]